MRGRRTSRRGLSNIIGAAFFVTLAILSLHVLVWQLSVYDSEFENARQNIQATINRFDENPEIVSMTVAATNNKLNATIRNDGLLLIQLVGLWISEYQTPLTASWHRRFQINQGGHLDINPGRNATNIGQQLIPAQTLTSTYTYVVKFITAKGNVIVGIYSPIGPVGKTGVSTTGYLFFTFDQDSFKMTNQTQTTPVQAWVVSPTSNQKVVWHVKVSNHGLYDLNLYKYSSLSLIKIAHSTSVTQDLFYIVNPATISYLDVSAYVDLSQMIPANPSGDYNAGGTAQWVKFSADGWTSNAKLTWNWNPTASSEYMVFMVFYYRYGTEDLTQIIPYVGIHSL